MSAQALDKETIRRAVNQFYDKTGWSFIAIKGNMGCSVFDEEFFNLLDSFMTYISDDLHWQNYEQGKKNVKANLYVVK